jgi:hypothetical protein
MRLSPYRADPPARRPVRIGNGRRFPGMLLSPVTFRITGQPSDPKTPPPFHARYAGYIAVRLVAHADHPVRRGRAVEPRSVHTQTVTRAACQSTLPYCALRIGRPHSLIATAVSRDAVVVLQQGAAVALLVAGCRKQPSSRTA